MCVRAVGAEGKSDGRVKDAKLPNHLLHTSDGALLVCVGKLDHQAGRSTLRGEREQRVSGRKARMLNPALPQAPETPTLTRSVNSRTADSRRLILHTQRL